MSKNDRKVLALTLAIILMFSMSVAVSAENMQQFNYGEELSGSEISSDLAEVKITVSVPEVLFSFDVSWDELAFEYEFSEWDPETHEYTGDGAWDKTEAYINVTNNSNADVSLDAIYEDYNSVRGVRVELSTDSWNGYPEYQNYIHFDLASAAGYGTNYAQFFVCVDGAPTNAEAVTQQTVGKVMLVFRTGWW